MNATMTNGRPERKQLSNQLDRLDSILDGLSGALNDAVADAAREGVKEAVTTAVIELLTNPDLKTALHKASGPESETKTSFWQHLKAKMSRGASQVKSVAINAVAAVANRVVAAGSMVARLTQCVRQSRPARIVTGWLLGIVTATLVAKYVVARRLGVITGAIQAMVVNVVERVSWWTDRTLYRLGVI